MTLGHEIGEHILPPLGASLKELLGVYSDLGFFLNLRWLGKNNTNIPQMLVKNGDLP